MAPDYKVYNFFKSKFLKHLRIFGQDRMAEELDQVRKLKILKGSFNSNDEGKDC